MNDFTELNSAFRRIHGLDPIKKPEKKKYAMVEHEIVFRNVFLYEILDTDSPEDIIEHSRNFESTYLQQVLSERVIGFRECSKGEMVEACRETEYPNMTEEELDGRFKFVVNRTIGR